jgi:hypothetical protein
MEEWRNGCPPDRIHSGRDGEVRRRFIMKMMINADDVI